MLYSSEEESPGLAADVGDDRPGGVDGHGEVELTWAGLVAVLHDERPGDADSGVGGVRRMVNSQMACGISGGNLRKRGKEEGREDMEELGGEGDSEAMMELGRENDWVVGRKSGQGFVDILGLRCRALGKTMWSDIDCPVYEEYCVVVVVECNVHESELSPRDMTWRVVIWTTNYI